MPALHPGSCERGRRRIGNDDRTVDDAAGSGVATRATSDVTTRLSNELTLRGFTLVTATDYVVYAMTTPGIGRAVCIGNTARQVQVALADDSGQPVPQSIKDQYIAGVNADRLIKRAGDHRGPDLHTDQCHLPHHHVARVRCRPDGVGGKRGAGGNPLAGQLRAARDGQTGSDWINDPTIRPNWLVGELAQQLTGARVIDDNRFWLCRQRRPARRCGTMPRDEPRRQRLGELDYRPCPTPRTMRISRTPSSTWVVPSATKPCLR